MNFVNLTMSDTVMAVTDNAQSFLLACSSIFLEFYSYMSTTDNSMNNTIIVLIVALVSVSL